MAKPGAELVDLVVVFPEALHKVQPSVGYGGGGGDGGSGGDGGTGGDGGAGGDGDGGDEDSLVNVVKMLQVKVLKAVKLVVWRVVRR